MNTDLVGGTVVDHASRTTETSATGVGLELAVMTGARDLGHLDPGSRDEIGAAHGCLTGTEPATARAVPAPPARPN